MSNENFDFGLSDILDESQDTGRGLAKGLVYLLGIVFFLLSALTTFQFFQNYAASIGAWAGADMGPYVAGVVGVVLLDFATLAWSYVRAKASSTRAQMTVALSISVICLVLSIGTSALYVGLSTTLQSGVYDPAGQLTQLGEILNYAGVAVIVLALGGNFFALYMFQNKSADIQQAAQNTSLAARVTQGRFLADEARAKMVIQRTLNEIFASLPEVADGAAAAHSQGYFSSKMGRQALPPTAQWSPALRQLAAMPPGGPDEIAQLRAILAGTPLQGPGDDAAGDDAMDLDALVDALVEERLRQERLAAAPAPAPGGNGNGNGANFTPRPGNGRRS